VPCPQPPEGSYKILLFFNPPLGGKGGKTQRYTERQREFTEDRRAYKKFNSYLRFLNQEIHLKFELIINGLITQVVKECT